MVYLQPKIAYPLPCCSLTQAQCHFTQAPALAALLPKLRLNSHTPRAVLFASHHYGGFSLLDYSVDQGCGQLCLLLGQLHLEDDDGKLLLILLSYLQLHMGSATPVFALNCAPYAKWIEDNWLTSLWQFLSQLKMTLDIQHHWCPKISWVNDIFLMDLALTLSYNPRQLCQLNSCRLYLRVLTIADIGKDLLPSALNGLRNPQRPSTLDWPTQLRPSPQDWSQWRTVITHLEVGNKLRKPLGPWITSPTHQSWTWFYDRCTHLVYHKNEDSWQEFQPVYPATSRHSCHTRPSYQGSIPCSVSPDTSSHLPTTIKFTTETTFSSYPSSTSFPKSAARSLPSLWPSHSIPPAFQNMPIFYQHLIGPTPPSQATCDKLSKELPYTLLACSDGAYDKDSGKGSLHWVFSSNLEQNISSGAGPVDGHPLLMSSYRAKLCGILAVLYIIHHICNYYHISHGTVICYCNNKGAVWNVHWPIHLGITPYIDTDHDIIQATASLLHLIPVTIMGEWVKGHTSDPSTEPKYA